MEHEFPLLFMSTSQRPWAPVMIAFVLAACGREPAAVSSIPVVSSAPSSVTAPVRLRVGEQASAGNGAVVYTSKADLESSIATIIADSSQAQAVVAAAVADGKAKILTDGARVAVRALSSIYAEVETLDGPEKGWTGWTTFNSVEPTGEPAPAASAGSSIPTPTPPPATYHQLTINEVTQGEGGKIIVTGATDLPEGATVNVDFNVIRANPKTESYVGVSDDVPVRAGTYRAELVPPPHPDLAKGPNEVEVVFAPARQTAVIQGIVGNNGERLDGPMLDTKWDVRTLKATKHVSIRVATPDYKIVSVTAYPRGTAERAVAEYLIAWKASDWQGMAALTQRTWAAGEADPVARVKAWHDVLEIVGAEITDAELVNEVMTDVSVRLTLTVGSEVKEETRTCRVIRESGPYQPDPDNGTWGVNPITC